MSNYIVKVICELENECYAHGTGFICSNEGYIVTCAHNVIHCKNVSVYYKNKIYDAKLIALDNRIDIAILKIEVVTTCPVISAILQYGSCYTFGFHHDNLCLSYQTGSIMTLNYVSKYAIDSTLTTIKGFKGASGSPVFNSKNEVIGIFSYESTIGSGGVVLRLLQQYLAKVNYSLTYIKISRSHTGLIVKPVTIDDILSKNIVQLREHVKGEYVTKVLQNKCPIEVNDIILSINTNIVGSGFITSESFVLYMNPKSKLKIKYLSYKENYTEKTCIICTIEFPAIYDKPLQDTTIMNLSFQKGSSVTAL